MEVIVGVISGIVGIISGYYIRYYLQHRKFNVDNINHHIDSIEHILDEMIVEATSINFVAISKNKLESHRLLMVARYGKLRRACEQINRIDKDIPIPSSKLIELKQSCDAVFEFPNEPHVLSQLFYAHTQLVYTYQRQSI